MTELLTAAQMRSLEQAAIDSGEVTGLELMERAGRGVVEAIFEEWPELQQTSHRAVVLCGPGNNGGDGFVVARLLKEWGWEVEAFLYGDPEKLPPDALVNYERWLGIGGGVTDIFARNDGEYDCSTCISMLDPWENEDDPVVVDALFGTGLTRGIEASLSNLTSALGANVQYSAARVIAVDLPSGLCSDSGRVLSPYHAEANLTVTFHSAKPGHFLAEGTAVCGRVVIKDIGIPEIAGFAARSALAGAISLLEESSFLPPPRPSHDPFGSYLRKAAAAHKYSYGHALVLGGGEGKGGAARLAARGALRSGAGLVTLGSPPAAMAENSARLDAIMLKRISNADSFKEALRDQRINALCIGPGFGTTSREQSLLFTALRHPRATILDADALTMLAAHEKLFRHLHKNCVLTPHAGEFARLFPDIADKLNAPATKGPAYSKVDATREAAARAGCVVLFKGADTVIADPTGQAAINSAHYDRAAPWLATAGSGDVLAGFITGLLARGFGPMQAAETAAWLHVECALSFGPGLIAEDLPEELPKVFRALGL